MQIPEFIARYSLSSSHFLSLFFSFPPFFVLCFAEQHCRWECLAAFIGFGLTMFQTISADVTRQLAIVSYRTSRPSSSSTSGLVRTLSLITSPSLSSSSSSYLAEAITSSWYQWDTKSAIEKRAKLWKDARHRTYTLIFHCAEKLRTVEMIVIAYILSHLKFINIYRYVLNDFTI